MKKLLLFLSLLPLAGIIYAAVGGTITIWQNAGNEIGSTTHGGSGNSGLGFLQVAHGPITYAVNISSYMVPGVTFTESLPTEVQAEVPYNTPGTLSGFWVMVLQAGNTLTLGSTVTVRINGAPGNEVVYIPAGASGEFHDTTHTDLVHAGNTVDYLIQTPTSGTGSILVVGAATVYTPQVNNMIKFVGGGQPYASSTNGFATYYEPIGGWLGAGGGFSNQTESVNAYNMTTGGTFSSLGIYVNTNGRAGTTTIRFRHNGANGNQTISIGAGQTGLFQDLTDVDTVVAGDTVTYSVTMDGGGGSGTFSASWMGSEFTTVGKTMEYAAQTEGHSFVPGVTYFWPIQGAGGYDSAEINDYQVLSQVPGTLSNMHIYVQSSTLNVNVIVTMRKNQSNCGPTLTIPAGVSGYFVDNADTCTVGVNDELDYEITTPAGTGSAPFSYIGALFTHS
jgi:hypothetical protein